MCPFHFASVFCASCKAHWLQGAQSIKTGSSQRLPPGKSRRLQKSKRLKSKGKKQPKQTCQVGSSFSWSLSCKQMQPNGIQSPVDNKHASNTDNCLLNSQIATGNELQKGGNMWKRTKSTSNNKNLLSHLVCIQSICSGVEHQRYCSEVTATGNLACSLQFNPSAAKCMAADDVFAGAYIFLHERESKATGFRSLLIRQNKGAFT